MAASRSSDQSNGDVRRIVASLVLSIASLALTIWILPGISVDGVGAAIAALVVVVALNTFVWPLVARFATPLIVLTAGLLGLVANAAVLLIAADLVDGFVVDNFWVALVAAFVTTGITAIVTSVLAIDDDRVWRRNVARRMIMRGDVPDRSDVPGVLFLQIDGLAEPVLRTAIRDGYAPTLARWVRSGSHRITRWECDLSSQTGASQAGILHGDNTDMPAFRWYDKRTGRVMTSNRPKDAAEIEAQRSDGHGLLAAGGVSRANVFSGDSPDSMFTFSTVGDKTRRAGLTGRGLAYVFSDPYFIVRLIVLSIADMAREIAAARRARHRDIRPRLERGGIYPLLRAGTTVMLRDLTVATLIGDIYRGVPIAYVDFVGYDEVAHHSGITAPDALEVLYRLDQQLERLEQAVAAAPRPYHIVVLSDHGQSQGATFLQRGGVSLPDLVQRLIGDGEGVSAPEVATEGWGNLNGALTDSIRDDGNRTSKLIAAAMRSRTVDGEVALGVERDELTAGRGDHQDDTAIVLASGNLGLVSFPRIEGRASIETLAHEHPGLVLALAAEPGIGFVLVHSDEFGAMVIGPHGVRYLADDRIEGVDPLATFGPNAADHLRRTDSFVNAPDILINSFYDPASGEGAAFEELIGFHGGMGGSQTEPFLLVPSELDLPETPIVGAAAVHALFTGWITEQADRADRPDQPGSDQPDQPDQPDQSLADR